jgi:hypothetical protein
MIIFNNAVYRRKSYKNVAINVFRPNHFFLSHRFKINRITMAKYAFPIEQGAVANSSRSLKGLKRGLYRAFEELWG